jgi:hypothetical protein
MTYALTIYFDAIRWWGALAGVIYLGEWAHRFKAGPVHYAPADILPMPDAVARLLVGVFLVIMGATTPMVSRYHQLVSIYYDIAVIPWTGLAMAGWIMATSRAQCRGMMIGVSVMALAVITLAAAMTLP